MAVAIRTPATDPQGVLRNVEASYRWFPLSTEIRVWRWRATLFFAPVLPVGYVLERYEDVLRDDPRAPGIYGRLPPVVKRTGP